MKINSSVIITTFASIVVYFLLSLLVDTLYMQDNSSIFNSFIKQAVIVLGIFLSGLILAFILKDKSESIDEYELKNEEEEIYEIAHNMLFSSPSLDIRLDKTLTKVQKLTNSIAVSVGIYEDNKIVILEQKSNIAKLFLERNIYPEVFKDVTKTNTSLSNIISEFKQTNKSYCLYDIELEDNNKLQCMLISLITEHSLKSFGVMSIVLVKDKIFTQNMKNYLTYISNAIAFSINISYKKDMMLQASMDYYKKYNEIDEKLNIFNKNKLTKTISAESERFKRYFIPLSVLAFSIDDMDNFINFLSDEDVINIKKSLCVLVKENIRSTDLFGSWNENTFVILATNVDYVGANILSNKLSKLIQENKFYRISKLTCSFGITSYSAKDTPTLFVKRAFSALQKAQLDGGNRSEIQLLV